MYVSFYFVSLSLYDENVQTLNARMSKYEENLRMEKVQVLREKLS